jgi:hypothetical protein
MESHGLEMAGPFRSGDGVDAIEIEAGTGNVIILTDVEVDGDTTFTGTVKFTSGSPASGKVIVSQDSYGNCSWAYASIPAGEIFLFEKDTAVTGYTLLTGVDDALVYITEGSPGGEAGGSYKSGGTWTQPTHEHGGLAGYTGYHTLTITEIPSHRHDFTPGFSGFTTKGGHAGEAHNGYPKQPYTSYVGGGGSHRHDLSGMSADGTPNTWRPYGINYTRQQKN